MAKMLTAEKVATLVKLMIRRSTAYHLAYDVRVRDLPDQYGCSAHVKDTYLTFEWRVDGKVVETHAIDWTCSTEERAWAHWEGFCENCGLGLKVGDKVRVESKSAWRSGGYRTVVVTDIGPRRVTVEGRYKHGGAFKVRASKAAILVRREV